MSCKTEIRFINPDLVGVFAVAGKVRQTVVELITNQEFNELFDRDGFWSEVLIQVLQVAAYPNVCFPREVEPVMDNPLWLVESAISSPGAWFVLKVLREPVQGHGVKLPQAKKGFILLPNRWVVEHSFAWTARSHRLARDYERLPETLIGLHFLAFALLVLKQAVHLITQSA